MSKETKMGAPKTTVPDRRRVKLKVEMIDEDGEWLAGMSPWLLSLAQATRMAEEITRAVEQGECDPACDSPQSTKALHVMQELAAALVEVGRDVKGPERRPRMPVSRG